MATKRTAEEFIEKSRLVHGDKYDYSKVEYVNNRTKVIITCPLHGDFSQTPHQHLSGAGCSKCKYNRGYKLNYNPIEGEIWKPIKGFEAFYKISNKGRLMSSFSGEWEILSNVNTKGWYFTIVLRNGIIKKTARIHRLVYESFVGSIPKGMIVHHINGDKQDNSVENLLLLTSKEHAQEHKFPRQMNQHNAPQVVARQYDGEYNNNINAIIYHNQHVRPRKILQCDMLGNVISQFDNSKEASVATGVCQRNILQVASKEPFNKKGGIRKQAGGYIWKFAE